MTETELTDRLREAIVLDGPDAWQRNGYLQDAQQAGLSPADALKRAKEISQEVSNNNLLFENIQARIVRMAQPSRSHLKEQDLNQIVNAATSLNLSPDFVRNRWVPTVLERLAPVPIPKAPELPVLPPTPVVVPPKMAPDAFDELLDRQPEPPKADRPIEPPAPVVQPLAPVESTPVIKPVAPVEPPPVFIERVPNPLSPPEPPPVVKSFTATPARVRKGQPVTLAWEVGNLLAVTIDDLGEGLSPVNRGWVKPQKTTDYTLFDANNNPLSTVRVEVVQPDRSGVYGVLFALALLALIYWFIRSTNSTATDTAPKPKRKTERTRSSSYEGRPRKSKRVNQPVSKKAAPTSEATDTQPETTSKPPAALPESQKKDNGALRQPVKETAADPEPIAKPATPADARLGKYEEAFGDKPYDKVELGADERGWRRARTNGRWGYVNAADEWVIKPEYEAVTPFKGNTAAVFLNGQLLTITRAGEQVRN